MKASKAGNPSTPQRRVRRGGAEAAVGNQPLLEPKGLRAAWKHTHTHTIVSTPVSKRNISTSAPAGETDCWGRSPAAPVGVQAFACSPLDESWCNEPQTGEQTRCFLSWSCPDYRRISGKKEQIRFRQISLTRKFINWFPVLQEATGSLW